MISENLRIDKTKTALLMMDYQNEIVSMLPQEKLDKLLQRARKILVDARQAGLSIIHVVVRFRKNYPEVSLRNRIFSALKEAGRLQEGTPGAEIHDLVAPQGEEVLVIKRRVGAFSATELEAILRAKGLNTLVMMGITTSGVVLSTLRWAADMDYQVIVISDGCADQDEEVHRVLTEKVFPRQATVVTAEQFLEVLQAMERNHMV